MPRRIESRRRGGNALIEFTLLGIPLLFITISIVSISVDMWEYHNLAYATDLTARYITMHGATCGANGNTCTINVGNIATFFKKAGMALDSSQTILYLTQGPTGSTTTTTCNPVSNCTSSTTQFPTSANNAVGSDITVKATYVLKNPVALFWPPDTDVAHDFTVGATSRQRILF